MSWIKDTHVSPLNLDEASDIEGFDIPLSESDASRIDRLVNDYENRIMFHLHESYEKTTSRADRLADKIAAFGGSWPFILIFAFFLLAWMVLNTVRFVGHFDPPPFILLNLILSFIAAFQAPIIMMSQNRQAARDKHEAIIDFAINYKAEQEIDDMQSHLHRIEAEVNEIKRLLIHLKDEAQSKSTTSNV